MDITGFRIEQSFSPGGTVCLVLHGELDLAGVPSLNEVLGELKAQSAHVELDLSRLGFMDSSGLATVLQAVLDARRNGWQLEVHRELTRPVRRLIEISGAGPYLWPEGSRALNGEG
jgi:anti-sigma B factor antagonist